jgi:acyl-CoA thioesterase II
MADFVADTAVRLDPHDSGLVHAHLTERWSVWGPNGGHLAATALRAGLACSRFDRPASFHCHFLAVGRFEAVEIRVRATGGGRRAESLAVEVHQGERMLLTAVLWTVDEALGGFEHAIHEAPSVPAPDALAPFHELVDDYDQWYPIWRSMEGRPVEWRNEPGAPVSQTWLRFNDTTVTDREADAVRQLFWMDYPGWNATISAHAWPFEFIAPNLDLTVQFHDFAPEADWMLADGVAPVARDGIVCTQARIWTEDGRLVASGSSSHVFRPNPGYDEELARAREQGLLPRDRASES